MKGRRDWTQGCVCHVLYADIGAPGQFRKIMACDQARSSFEKNFAATLCANLPSLFSLPSLSFSFEYFLAMEATSLYFRNNRSNYIFARRDLDQSFEKEKGTFEVIYIRILIRIRWEENYLLLFFIKQNLLCTL